jgi:hypothetical protein
MLCQKHGNVVCTWKQRSGENKILCMMLFKTFWLYTFGEMMTFFLHYLLNNATKSFVWTVTLRYEKKGNLVHLQSELELVTDDAHMSGRWENWSSVLSCIDIVLTPNLPRGERSKSNKLLVIHSKREEKNFTLHPYRLKCKFIESVEKLIWIENIYTDLLFSFGCTGASVEWHRPACIEWWIQPWLKRRANQEEMTRPSS